MQARNSKQEGGGPDHRPFRLILPLAHDGFQYWERIHSREGERTWARVGQVTEGTFAGASMV